MKFNFNMNVKKEKRNSGHTLIEVLITITVFSMVMASIFTVFIKGMGYSREGESEMRTFRELSIAFSRISNDLMCKADRILYPAADVLSYNGSSSIVFSTFGEAPQVIGYVFDSNKSCINKVLYSSDFDASLLSSASLLPSADNPKTILSKVANAIFIETESGILQVSMTVKGKREHSLITRIELRNP